MNEHREIGFENFDQWVNSRKWVSWWIGLNDPTPTSAPSKKSCYGISWMGWKCPLQVSLLNQFIFSFFFFLWLYFFFPILVFSYLFIYYYYYYLGSMFFGPPLTPIFFWEVPTYCNPPTAFLPPFFLLTTYLRHLANPLPTHLLLRSLCTSLRRWRSWRMIMNI
jgi:hypothetical protein